MFAMPGLRAFSLAAGRDSGGVSCDGHGVFVGDVALLQRERAGNRNGPWTVRPVTELSDELTVRYRLPIDIAAKARALTLIAEAFNRGDLALAAIATVQMQFPDPPPLAKRAETAEEIMRRAADLFHSRLLKADPDWDARHPRTGAPPNPGWFAPVPKDMNAPDAKPRKPGWPLTNVNIDARDAVKKALAVLERNAGRILIGGLELNPWVEGFLAGFSPVELNQGEDRLTAQLKASLQPPKTLEELQQKPTENILGYEQHHIVEQNPSNIEKGVIEKFGSARINDPSNLVWVPHFPHLEISADYSSVPDNDGGPTRRERVKEWDFGQQREFGLSKLRKYGVLK